MERPFRKSLPTLLALYSAGFSVSVVGLLVMVGWYTHSSSLIQINPAYTPMQYNTALCFLLAGLGLITYFKFPHLSVVLGFIIFLIGAITLTQYIFSVNTGLDQLFLTPYIITNTIYPGRMAPNSSLYMSLIGFILAWRTPPLPSLQNLPLIKFTVAIFVALAGLIGFFGYLFDIRITYGWGYWAQMAIHTSLCFAFIGAGLATVIWHNHQLHRIKKNITLPIIIIVLGNLVFILLWQVLVENEHNAILQKSQERGIALDKLLTNKLNDYILELKRFPYRYPQNTFATDDPLIKDAKSYFHDMPTLVGLMITGVRFTARPLLLQTQTSDAKQLMKQCAALNQHKHSQNSTLFVISHLQIKYLCLAKPLPSQQLFVALFNISQLVSDTIEQVIDGNNYAVRLLLGGQVLYQSPYKNTTYQRMLEVTIPMAFQDLSLQLQVWPNESLVKRSQSWFPIISLVVGLFVTFVLALMVHLFQLLVQKEKKFRSVLNTTSDAIIIVNRNSEVILANEAALNLFEYAENEMLGMFVESLMPERFRKTHKINRHSYMQSPVTRGMGVTSNIVLLTKHRKEIPVEIGLNPLQMNFEQCVLCSIHDMRIAKSNEQRLIQQSQTMQIVFDITNAIVTEESSNVALQRCLNIICTNLQWPIGHVYTVDTNNQDLLIPSEIWFLKDAAKVSHFRDVTMNTPLHYGVGLPGRVLASNDLVWIDDVCLETTFSRASAAKIDNLHSAFSFPIAMHGKIKVIFEFFSYELKKKDKNLMLIINILKNQMSHFLEYQSIQELNKNLVTRFKFAVASGEIGVWEYDVINKKLIWDKQMYRLYGINSKIKNLSNLTWENALHPDDLKKATEELQLAIMEKKTFDTVFRIIKPNGDVRYIHANAMLIHSADGVGKTILGLSRDITEEKQLNEKLKQLNDRLVHQAYYDYLTGLMNRHALSDEATRLFFQAKRYRYQLGILFIDLDNFKIINDKFGHNVGDELLVEVAKKLKKILRAEDVICRMGGDEFVVILNNISKTEDTVVIAKKIIDSITQPFHLSSHEVHISASVGISLYPKAGETFADLLSKADTALLQAKNAGKGCLRVFKEK